MPRWPRWQSAPFRDPIRSTGGYYILALRARQEPLGTKIAKAHGPHDPAGSLPLARLLLPLGAGTPKEMADSAGKIADQYPQQFSGCDQLRKLPDRLKGAVYMNLGNMRLGDLSPEIQKALANTHSGEGRSPSCRTPAWK